MIEGRLDEYRKDLRRNPPPAELVQAHVPIGVSKALSAVQHVHQCINVTVKGEQAIPSMILQQMYESLPGIARQAVVLPRFYDQLDGSTFFVVDYDISKRGNAYQINSAGSHESGAMATALTA